MGKYIAWRDRPPEEQARGDRIQIWRGAAKQLTELPEETFNKSIRIFFGWFVSGQLPQMDPFTKYIVDGLIDSQLRAVKEAKEKSETNTINARKSHLTTSGGQPSSSSATEGQPSLPVAPRRESEQTVANDGQQVEAQAKVQADEKEQATEHQNHHQISPPTGVTMTNGRDSSPMKIPTLQDCLNRFQKMGYTTKGIRYVYDKIANMDWRDGYGRMIGNPYMYFDRCYKRELEENPDEINFTAAEIDEQRMARRRSRYD